LEDNFDFVEFWAKEFKKAPERNRKVLNKFINSQISIAQARLKSLEPSKLIKLFNIKNQKIIDKILKKNI